MCHIVPPASMFLFSPTIDNSLMINPKLQLLAYTLVMPAIVHTITVPTQQTGSDLPYTGPSPELNKTLSDVQAAKLQGGWEQIMSSLVQRRIPDKPIDMQRISDQPVESWQTCNLTQTRKIVFTDQFKATPKLRDHVIEGSSLMSGMMERHITENSVAATYFAARETMEDDLKKRMYSMCYDVWERSYSPNDSGFNKMCCVRGRDDQVAVCPGLGKEGGWCCAICQTTELKLNQSDFFDSDN